MNVSTFIEDVARSVGFLSRMPMPSRYFIGHDGSLSRAVCAFPAAGLLIALPSAAVFAMLLAFGADSQLAAILSLAVAALITGALHEDGLSDTADGIGGGRDREAALRIMKDSRIGSYGAVALVLSFAIRAAALASIGLALTPTLAALALVAAATLSRAAMVWHWSLLPPARADGIAASAGMPERDASRFALLSGTAVAVLLWLPVAGLAASAATVALTALAVWLFTRHIRNRIGGHTGDTIGAAQQLTEIMSLSALAVLV
jgi:adenosylcobinamide-GDP ribazoletransferase